MKKFDKDFAKKISPGLEEVKVISDYIKKSVGNVRGKKIIDMGCGQGHYAYIFANMGARVVGIDKSKEQLRLAKSHNSIQYKKMDIIDIGIKPNFFDIALLNFVLIGTKSEGNIRKIIAESKRLLKKGGILVLSEVHPHNLNRRNSIDYMIAKNGEGYFDRGAECRSIVRLSNGKKIAFDPDYHRTLEFFINAVIEKGFAITKFIEPKYKEKFPQYMIIIARKVK